MTAIIQHKKFPFAIIPLMLLSMAVLLSNCEERFTPNLDAGYKNLLVVEGSITNLPGPYTVKLSSSTLPNDNRYVPLSGYRVIISDNMGNAEVLTESDAGVYKTSPDGIQGIIGRGYKIDITATNGKTYASGFEKLPQPVVIDSVYTKIEYSKDDRFPTDVAGYRFYLDTKLAAKDSSYLLWDLTATYKYKSDYIIRWIYDGELRPWTNSDSLRTCYQTKDILELFVYSTQHLTVPKLKGFPLHYVPVSKRDLSIRYSLLTSQYTMSKEAYVYWNAVREQHATQDELYSRQPYQLQGNIFNAENPDENVLGYFLVAGEDEKRIFVDKPDPPIKMRYTVCKLSFADYQNFGLLFLSLPSEWPLYATFDNNGANAYPNQDCLDCRLRGGTIEKPEFWIDE